jgi:hypothetical protein
MSMSHCTHACIHTCIQLHTDQRTQTGRPTHRLRPKLNPLLPKYRLLHHKRDLPGRPVLRAGVHLRLHLRYRLLLLGPNNHLHKHRRRHRIRGQHHGDGHRHRGRVRGPPMLGDKLPLPPVHGRQLLRLRAGLRQQRAVPRLRHVQHILTSGPHRRDHDPLGLLAPGRLDVFRRRGRRRQGAGDSLHDDDGVLRRGVYVRRV